MINELRFSKVSFMTGVFLYKISLCDSEIEAGSLLELNYQSELT